MKPFWGLHYLTVNGHPSSFWKAIYGTLIAAGSNTECTVPNYLQYFLFLQNHIGNLSKQSHVQQTTRNLQSGPKVT